MANKRSHAEVSADLLYEKGLPADVDTERLCLGAVLVDGAKWEILSSLLSAEDFHLEKHRRIFARMSDVAARGDRVDKVTLTSELMTQGQLESVDGMTYLSSLDEGLPDIVALDVYCRIVREKADLRKVIISSQRAIDQALGAVGPAKDIAAAQVLALEGVQAGQVSQEDDGKTVEQIVTAYPGGAGVFLDPTLRKRGLATGFRKIDEMLGGGLQDGELIILAARPGVGKSALALNIAHNVVMRRDDPKRVDFFSLEMSAASLVTRMICGEARVSNSKFRAGFLGRDERSALQTAMHFIGESPLRIHDEFRRTLQSLMARIKRAAKNDSRLIVIDYIQLLVSGSKNENRNLEIGEIGRGLKLAALDLNMPILILSQIGRMAEKRAGGGNRPQLSDLKDSGTLEENADTVLTIFREELYSKDRQDIKGLADLDVLKQRNGELGRIPLRFLGQFVRFEGRVEDTEFPEQGASDPEPPPMAPAPQQEDGW